MNNYKRGFTLIELLMTIGIIAVLVTVVILVINPVELMKQSRDAIRIEDLNSLNKAINFYITNAETPHLGTSTQSLPRGGVCYTSLATSTGFTDPHECIGRFRSLIDGGPGPEIVAMNSKAIDGTGWIPINFNEIKSFGLPLSVLPIDPVTPNTFNKASLSMLIIETAYAGFPDVSDDRYYAYATDGIEGFEINARLESTKYATKASNDGGDNDLLYEVGNISGLNL